MLEKAFGQLAHYFEESQMADWYAGCIIYRKNDKNEREFLVIDTKSLHPDFKGRSKVQTKFPGGTEQGHEKEDKTVEDTRDRELFEETDLCIRPGYDPRVIHTETMPGHFKVFYLIPFEELFGDIRTGEKTVDLDWMSAPYWLNRFKLMHILYKSHQSAFSEAIMAVE